MRSVYLNNAAEGWPKAPGVVEAVAEALRDMPAPPGRAEGVATDAAAECRQRIASLLGADNPSRIVLTAGATHSLNLAILGLRLGPGARVVTSVLEHNSVLRPLERLSVLHGIQVTHVGLDLKGEFDKVSYADALRQGADLVVLTHASNVTGQVLDVQGLFAMAKAAAATTLLDAAQTAGILPLNAPELGADLVAIPGHKGLHGPPGAGALYVRPGLELDPLFTGGTGVRSESLLHPLDMPLRLEAGTPNVPALRGLASALAWAEGSRIAVFERVSSLASPLVQGLRDCKGLTTYGRSDGRRATGIVSFSVNGWSAADAGQALTSSFGIVCRSGLHCAPLAHRWIGSPADGCVRLSLSQFSTEEDVRYVLESVRRLAA